ncbi:hypothetical protein [Metallosphaera hakonensis]
MIVYSTLKKVSRGTEIKIITDDRTVVERDLYSIVNGERSRISSRERRRRLHNKSQKELERLNHSNCSVYSHSLGQLGHGSLYKFPHHITKIFRTNP